jgi:hypothetical protein
VSFDGRSDGGHGGLLKEKRFVALHFKCATCPRPILIQDMGYSVCL